MSDRCPLGDFFQLSCVKLRSHEQICLIYNKDDLAVKKTKMTIYTNNVFAQVIFGAFLSFLCTR